ncbi:HtaA domain-containing protein [Streptomyces sp. NPDC021020]|uniref:HtaA domain-containing protein n=1 Tax=Streptomyces sp. NPDC021020 TaxID=3365109 RepID=UPI00378918F0
MTARIRTRSRRTALATAVVLAAGAAALGMPALASAAGGGSLPLSGGTFDWGVKQSFRSYVTGAAQGTITTADGATANSDGTFRFTAGTGSYDTATHAVTVTFKGSVEFASTAHGFDITLGDLKVATQGTSGTLTADVTAGGSTADDVEFATLDLSGVRPGSGADGAMTFDGIPAALTAAGAQAFNGMYVAGTALDPADLAVKADAPSTPPTTPPTTPATTPPTTPASPGGPAAVVDGNLDWGVKESFRTYVTGPIAAGKVELTGGATATAAGYRFPKGTGTWDAAGTELNASFSGGVRFLGHLQQGTYALDLKLSDLKVHTEGATGTLTADVASKDLASGKVTDYDDLAIADLGGVAPAAKDGVVTVAAAKATLTADGAKVFSGFYEKGAALDPVTLAVSLSDDAGLPTAAPTTGGTSGGTSGGAGTSGGTGTDGAGSVGGTGAQLAETGAGVPTGALVGAAGALVLAGAAFTVTAARRRA